MRRVHKKRRCHVVMPRLEPCRAAGIQCGDKSSVESRPIPEPTIILPPAEAKAQFFECMLDAPTPENTSTKEEEEEESQEVAAYVPQRPDEPNVDDIEGEMATIKASLDEINELLSLNIPECPDMDPCIDPEVELQVEIHPDILQLQRDNYKLKRQIDDLQVCCLVSDASLKDLETNLCAELEESVRINTMIDELNSFKMIMEREFALCTQRFRHLEADKYDWLSCHNFFNYQMEEAKLSVSKSITKLQHIEAKRDCMKMINQAKRKCKKLHDQMQAWFRKMSEAQDRSLPMESPEITRFLEANEKLFKKSDK